MTQAALTPISLEIDTEPFSVFVSLFGSVVYRAIDAIDKGETLEPMPKKEYPKNLFRVEQCMDRPSEKHPMEIVLRIFPSDELIRHAAHYQRCGFINAMVNASMYGEK
jgi:hypothetical protein